VNRGNYRGRKGLHVVKMDVNLKFEQTIWLAIEKANGVLKIAKNQLFNKTALFGIVLNQGKKEKEST
jgi:hypothetical protein